MKFTVIALLVSSVLSIQSSHVPVAQQAAQDSIDFNKLSEQMLHNIKAGKSTRELREQLAKTTLKDLVGGLKTDDEKIAFWVNIYNAYIQVILSENPELYKDRGEFFKKDQIPIAGSLISFAKIEHGIIRKSQWELGLGMIPKLFPDKYERELRVDEPDYQIHFALNCGAKDCPPVAIYQADRLDEQFEKGTKAYLKQSSTYNPDTEEVAVTSLFNWFRGDFGFERGIKEILKKYDIIPQTEGVDISYKDYDWTLDLDNFTDL